MKYVYFALILTIFAVMNGCGYEASAGSPEEIAEKYLIDTGYEIIELRGTLEPYVLTREKLTERPYQDDWFVQPIAPDKLIGEEIHRVGFVIKNHPFDEWDSLSTKGLGKTFVDVFVANGKVVGGTSHPITKELMAGCCFYIDGRTDEEIHGVDYQTRLKAWQKKYRD